MPPFGSRAVIVCQRNGTHPQTERILIYEFTPNRRAICVSARINMWLMVPFDTAIGKRVDAWSVCIIFANISLSLSFFVSSSVFLAVHLVVTALNLTVLRYTNSFISFSLLCGGAPFIFCFVCDGTASKSSRQRT